VIGHKNAHTFSMTLKNAAFFAVVGMALLTVLETVRLITDVSGVMRGFIPAVTLLSALIFWVASLSVLVFFGVYYAKQ
jgi:hypothetical protein